MSDVLERPPPQFDKRITYGPDSNHFAELRFPKGGGPFPLLLMIHGGFWQSVYDLKHTGLLCADLTSKGLVTCNLEYRRIGDLGGGWPGTFQDISLASHQIPRILSSDRHVDLTRTAVMGHSAGGHLALWLVSSDRVPKTSSVYDEHRSPFTSVVSLAGVSDLRTAYAQRLGRGIVRKLVGGTPDQHPDRYDEGSPIELLPNKARLVLIHGTADMIVPISQCEEYGRRAQLLGQECKMIKLENTGHFELIDPDSNVWATVAGEILTVLSK